MNSPATHAPQHAAPHAAGFTTPRPRCSVVMPVYNTPEPYLRAAIESILHQSFTDFELLLVDDHSAPYVSEIVSSYTDARLRYRRLEEQSGAAVARNCALDTACGEYIAFMDSDDISLPSRLQKQVDYLDAHPEIGCLGTNYQILDNRTLRKAPTVPHEHEGIVSYLLFCGCAFCQSSVMLRRDILEEFSIRYRTEYVPAEDYALWLDLIGKTHFAILPDELVCYHMHNQSVSHKSYSIQMEKFALAQSHAWEVCGGFTFEDQCLWAQVLQGTTLTSKQYEEISLRLQQVISALYDSGELSPQDVLPAVRVGIRKALYNTRTFYGHWKLLHLPIVRCLGLPLWWRIFCFISRVLFMR